MALSAEEVHFCGEGNFLLFELNDPPVDLAILLRLAEKLKGPLDDGGIVFSQVEDFHKTLQLHLRIAQHKVNGGLHQGDACPILARLACLGQEAQGPIQHFLRVGAALRSEIKQRRLAVEPVGVVAGDPMDIFEGFFHFRDFFVVQQRFKKHVAHLHVVGILLRDLLAEQFDLLQVADLYRGAEQVGPKLQVFRVGEMFGLFIEFPQALGGFLFLAEAPNDVLDPHEAVGDAVAQRLFRFRQENFCFLPVLFCKASATNDIQ